MDQLDPMDCTRQKLCPIATANEQVGGVPPDEEGLDADEELGPGEEVGARQRAIPDRRFGVGSDRHRRTLLEHKRRRDSHRAGQWARG
jgi:hypothetical protein